MVKKHFLLVMIAAAAAAGCTGDEKGNEKSLGDGAVFADYKISGEEGKQSVIVLLQYRMGGKDGNSLALEAPATVAFDSVILDADSAGISGPYYEAAFPLEEFTGTHLITYTSTNGRVHNQPVNFTPFRLAKELPHQLPMLPITLPLSGLPESTLLWVLMTDTAFDTNDVHTKIAVQKGGISITNEMWRSLKPGPVVLEIYYEDEKPINGISEKEGVMTISYGLKKEFTAVANKGDTLRKLPAP